MARFDRLARSAALAGGLVMAAAPAFAQEGVLFQNLMQNVFGKSAQDEIDYRSRPPLVVPPNSQLPRPQDPASARNAAWPNDPDVARRKDDGKQTPFVLTEKGRHNPMLSQAELRKGRVVGRDQSPRVTEELNTYNNQIEPIRIGRDLAARRNAEVELLDREEPPRRFLVEPPVGYRKPAATAAAGPGKSGPAEDKQSLGIREFFAGIIPTQ